MSSSYNALSRRHFLMLAGAVAAGFGGLRRLDALAAAPPGAGYGPLLADADGILDLPAGFSYRVISREGQAMDDGLIVPGNFDGMAAFPGPNGRTILVRNHEIEAKHIASGSVTGAFGKDGEKQKGLDATRIYNVGADGIAEPGGTSTLVYDARSGTLERQFLSLVGTRRNCAGGPTPWNSWITCEETHSKSGGERGRAHGYNFEVPASAEVGLTRAVPLRAMGRFFHEAVAVEPLSGAVFQTEDRDDGLITRFLPDVKGDLARGGKLQALQVKGRPSLDTRNWEQQSWKVGQSMEVEWLDLAEVDSEEDDLRLRGFEQGAARFARGEGMWFGANGAGKAIYFACTSGGAKRKGQVWRLDPIANVLTLWVQPDDGHIIENADNLTVAPWGDVFLSEDLASVESQPYNWLSVVTRRGEVFKFARNVFNRSEMAGVTFSPDGSTLFVNIYAPGMTLAIQGPFEKRA